MHFTHDVNGPLVLLGGTGVVGRNVAPMLARAFPRHELVLGGRHSASAGPVLAAVEEAGGRARFEELVLGSATRREQRAAAVLAAVNDPTDEALSAAIAGGVPYVDITRWTSRLAVAVGRVAAAGPLAAPVVFSSAWMAGLLPRVVAHLAPAVGERIEVEGSVRYALADASGVDSVEYIDRAWVPFEVTEAGRPRLVEPFRDRRTVKVDGKATLVGRFDTPEQWSLPFTLGVHRAAVRIGFDSTRLTRALFVLVRLGLFWLLRGERHRALRHSLLREKGSERRAGARTAFRVDVRGTEGARSLTLSFDRGQAALTAAGAVLSVRQALALGGRGGVFFPELDPANADLPRLLAELGVGVHTVAAEAA